MSEEFSNSYELIVPVPEIVRTPSSNLYVASDPQVPESAVALTADSLTAAVMSSADTEASTATTGLIPPVCSEPVVIRIAMTIAATRLNDIKKPP